MSNQQFPGFNMHSLNQQEVQKTIEANKANSGGDINWISTEKPGRYVFYVLPPFNSRGVCGLIVGKHYNIPNEKGEQVAHTNVEVTFPGRGWVNPIQQVINKYKAMGVDVEDYETQQKAYIPVLVQETPDHPNGLPGVHILRHTPITLSWIYEKLTDKYYPTPIFHPTHGCPISITRTGVKGNTKYERQVLPNTPWLILQGLDQNQQIAKVNEVLATVPDLDKIFNVEEAYLETIKSDAARLDDLLNRKVVMISQGVVAGNPNQAGYPSSTAQQFIAPPPPGAPPAAQPYQAMPQPVFNQPGAPAAQPNYGQPAQPSYQQPGQPAQPYMPPPPGPAVPPVQPVAPPVQPVAPPVPTPQPPAGVPLPPPAGAPLPPPAGTPPPAPFNGGTSVPPPPSTGAPIPGFPQFPTPNQ